MKTIKKELKHYFSEDEINGMAKEMSLNIQIRTSKIDEKDSVTRFLKNEIDQLEKQNEVLAKYINSGFKSEFKECKVENNYSTGKIIFTDVDTGEVIDVELMDGYQDGSSIFSVKDVEVTIEESDVEKRVYKQ
jgi:hypothetical protein